jgi:perosamine synthetase
VVPSVTQDTRVPGKAGGVGGWVMGERERELVAEVLVSDILWNGAKTREFEEEVARLHDRRIAIFLNSGTTAIQVALHALKRLRGWSDGDEILIPGITFVGTINPVLYNGLKPVFVDVDPDHYDMDPAEIEKHITPRTRAILPVHFLGQPCMIEKVMEIAEAHDLVVVEDSCETNYVHRHGKVVASSGAVACLSTFMVHLLHTGIGGFDRNRRLCDDRRRAAGGEDEAAHQPRQPHLQAQLRRRLPGVELAVGRVGLGRRGL